MEDEAGLRVLRLRGDLDAAAVTRFQSLRGREPAVVDVIDAGDVSFISSAGLAVMLRTTEASTAAGHRPVLRATSHPVDRLLQLTGMDGAFARPGATPDRAAESDEPTP
jgi:anti-anti-sigma factor